MTSEHHYISSGMTVLEVLLSIMMLSVFTGVVATVMQFTVRFAGEAEPGAANPGGQSRNGVLIDHQEIQLIMDRLVDVLQQPGISKERLDGTLVNPNTGKTYGQIAFDPKTTTDPSVGCTDAKDPLKAWGLDGPPSLMPDGYMMCLWKTTEKELPLKDLILNNSKGGIYVLQALPKKLSASALPARRLFCRPHPYC